MPVDSLLDFAGKHDVRPMVEVQPMSAVNEGIRKVREDDARFRVVLEGGKSK